jgi:hypothetical protein
MRLSLFQNIINGHEFMKMCSAAFQACLEYKIPRNSVVSDEEAIEECLWELHSAIQETTTPSASKRRHVTKTSPFITPIIQ